MKRLLSLFLLVGSLFVVISVQAATTPVKTAPAKATPAKAVVVKKAPIKPAVKAVKIVEPYVKVGMTKASYDAIVKSVTDFVNNELLSGGEKLAKVIITKKSGYLYFVDITLSDNRVVKSVFFKDKAGDYFFPTAMNITETIATNKKAKATAPAPAPDSPTASAPTSLVKSDKPVVEVFVMSYCPYGTQIEKGLIPVIKTLGDKADIQIKFVSYTMHGAKENAENIMQYCINKEQPAKFLPYLECFLKEADSVACLKSTAVDTDKTTACIAASTSEFKLVDTGTDFPIYKAENIKYGVQGSPTLVINGAEASSGRSSGALLKTICSAFTTAPAECSTALDTATPAPGFGTATTAATSPASCGS
jgi:hypothetical protein